MEIIVLTIGDTLFIFLIMEILWDLEKNLLLLKSRSVSFEMVLDKISTGDFLGPEQNPSRLHQYSIIVEFDGYPYVVPLIIDKDGNWFLKTIYPSRKERRRKNND